MLRLIPIYLATLVSITDPALGSPQTLQDALASAYRTNPALLAEREAVRVEDESYIQAREAFGPTINANVDADYQQAEVDQLNSAGQKYTARSIGRTTTSQIVMSQPLYSGGKLTANVRVSSANVFSARQALRVTEQQIFHSVIQSYADVWRDRNVVTVYDRSINSLNQELQAIQAKLNAGAATISDQAEVLARIASANVQLSNARSQLEISEAGYVRTVGLSPGNNLVIDDLPGIPSSLESALKIGIASNPTLAATIYAENVTCAKIAVMESDFRPTVTARIAAASVPLEQYQTGLINRTLTLGITINFPSFASGTHNSALRQAKFSEIEAQLRVSDSRRDLIKNVIQYWAAFNSAKKIAKLYSDQVSEEEIVYDSLEKQYKAGLLSTIELLNSTQELANAEAAHYTSMRDAVVSEADLLNAVGLLEANAILPHETLYRPEAAGNEKFGGAPFFPQLQIFPKLAPIPPVVECAVAIGGSSERALANFGAAQPTANTDVNQAGSQNDVTKTTFPPLDGGHKY